MTLLWKLFIKLSALLGLVVIWSTTTPQNSPFLLILLTFTLLFIVVWQLYLLLAGLLGIKNKRKAVLMATPALATVIAVALLSTSQINLAQILLLVFITILLSWYIKRQVVG